MKRLTHKELISKFKKDHIHNSKLYPSSKFSYILTPTGIGTKVVMMCNVCGQTKDITAYENW